MWRQKKEDVASEANRTEGRWIATRDRTDELSRGARKSTSNRVNMMMNVLAKDAAICECYWAFRFTHVSFHSHVSFVNGFTPGRFRRFRRRRRRRRRFMFPRSLTLLPVPSMTVNTTLNFSHVESRLALLSFIEARGILVGSDVAWRSSAWTPSKAYQLPSKLTVLK